MVLKIFKAVWFLSLLATLAIFMYVYASLPENVIIQETGNLTLSRESIFYLSLFVLAIFNMMVFVFTRLFVKGSEDFLSWFFGLIITLNLFFVITLSYLNLYNGGEHFDYSRIGVIIYGSIGLVIAWAVAWPVYLFFLRFSGKRPV